MHVGGRSLHLTRARRFRGLGHPSPRPRHRPPEATCRSTVRPVHDCTPPTHRSATVDHTPPPPPVSRGRHAHPPRSHPPTPGSTATRHAFDAAPPPPPLRPSPTTPSRHVTAPSPNASPQPAAPGQEHLESTSRAHGSRPETLPRQRLEHIEHIEHFRSGSPPTWPSPRSKGYRPTAPSTLTTTTSNLDFAGL